MEKGEKAVPPNSPASGSATPLREEAIQYASGLREIAISLDTYDDIFSDFDPRPYERRELSEDFLKEMSRRFYENPKGGIEVRFLIPADMREPRYEMTIRKRLRGHFAHEHQDVKTHIEKERGRGMRYAGAGFILLGLETASALWWTESQVLPRLVSWLLVPAGWYLMWTGIEKLVEVPAEWQHKLDLNERFVKCEYIFVTIEND